MKSACVGVLSITEYSNIFNKNNQCKTSPVKSSCAETGHEGADTTSLLQYTVH